MHPIARMLLRALSKNLSGIVGARPLGYVANGDDCNDPNPLINPDADGG